MSSTTVLLVDDDDDLRDVLAAALRAAGYDVVAEATGRAALDRLRAGLKPAAILLDLMMPGMTGWELHAELRRDTETAAIPIAILTARGRTDETGEPALGGVPVLRKPFALDTLTRLIDELVAPPAPKPAR